MNKYGFIMIALVTSIYIYGCQNIEKKQNSVAVSIKDSISNIEKYKIAQKNNLNLKDFQFTNNYSIYINKGKDKNILDYKQFEIVYKVKGLGTKSVNSQNSYSILDESRTSIMDVHHWYDGEYEIVDNGSKKQKTKNSPETVNNEIKDMLSSSFVSFEGIKNEMITKSSNGFKIKLTIENKKIIEDLIKKFQLYDVDSYKTLVNKVNEFEIYYKIKDDYIIEESVKFDFINNELRMKGENSIKLETVTPVLKFPANEEEFEVEEG